MSGLNAGHLDSAELNPVVVRAAGHGVVGPRRVGSATLTIRRSAEDERTRRKSSTGMIPAGSQCAHDEP